MMPCCRRHQPRPRETFLDDPQLLGIRPAPTPASIYNVKATHLTTISKDIHIDSQLQTGKNRKAAVLGRVRRGAGVHAICSAIQDALRSVGNEGIVYDSHNHGERVWRLLNNPEESRALVEVVSQ